jgi:hypothetical protein
MPGEQESRFALVMEPPFDQVRFEVAVHSMQAVMDSTTKITAALAAAAPGMNAYSATLKDAELEINGTFDPGCLIASGLFSRDEVRASLCLPPDEQQAVDDAAKQAINDVRLAMQAHPGNSYHVAPGAVSVSLE